MFERLMTNKMFALSMASVIVAALFVLLQLPGVASAVLAPGISHDTTPANLKQWRTEHDKENALYRDRFKGRSIFFTPPAPPVNVVSRPVVEDSGPPPPPPPPPEPTIPSSYGGPGILAIIGNQVYLEGGKIVKLGEKEDSLGLTVLEFVPPWSVKVQWLKKPGNYAPGEYVVELFGRDYDKVFAREGSKSSDPQGLSVVEDTRAAAAGDRPSASPVVED